MQITYQYFTDQYLGSTTTGCECCYVDCEERGACRGPSNVALCCPLCGTIWARVIAEGSRHWMFEDRFCRKCPATDVFGRPIASGTFTHYLYQFERDLTRWKWGLAIENFPLAVLTWDFLREFEHFERMQNGKS